MRYVLLLTVMTCALAGCTRFRFVVDAVPAADDLTETTVYDEDGGFGAAKIVLVDVTGLLVDAERPGFPVPGENPVARFAEDLRRAENDSSVKALIVRINSPGGAVTASDIMYRELSHFKERSGRPVVILMGDVAASGGYYLACAGDEIVAHPTTITGSIGVIFQTFNFSEGMNRIGIRADAITSGPNKDMGNPFEPPDPDHRALLQNIVNEFYGSFVAIVRDSRPELHSDDLPTVTDGRVVTGRRAAELGLVDRLGDLYDAFDAAKERAGLTRARLVKYHRPIEHVGSAYAEAPNPPSAASQINLLQFNLDSGPIASQTGFYYLWDPTVW
jgi:protease-4